MGQLSEAERELEHLLSRKKQVDMELVKTPTSFSPCQLSILGKDKKYERIRQSLRPSLSLPNFFSLPSGSS